MIRVKSYALIVLERYCYAMFGRKKGRVIYITVSDIFVNDHQYETRMTFDEFAEHVEKLTGQRIALTGDADFKLTAAEHYKLGAFPFLVSCRDNDVAPGVQSLTEQYAAMLLMSSMSELKDATSAGVVYTTPSAIAGHNLYYVDESLYGDEDCLVEAGRFYFPGDVDKFRAMIDRYKEGHIFHELETGRFGGYNCVTNLPETGGSKPHVYVYSILAIEQKIKNGDLVNTNKGFGK